MDNRFTIHDYIPTHPPLTLAQLARKEQERLERIYTTLVDFDRQAAAVIWQQARAWKAHAEELDDEQDGTFYKRDMDWLADGEELQETRRLVGV